MTVRRVAFRQCDVTRALKAAKAAGAGQVVIDREGKITIVVDSGDSPDDRREPVGRRREIVF